MEDQEVDEQEVEEVEEQAVEEQVVEEQEDVAQGPFTSILPPVLLHALLQFLHLLHLLLLGGSAGGSAPQQPGVDHVPIDEAPPAPAAAGGCPPAASTRCPPLPGQLLRANASGPASRYFRPQGDFAKKVLAGGSATQEPGILDPMSDSEIDDDEAPPIMMLYLHVLVRGEWQDILATESIAIWCAARWAAWQEYGYWHVCWTRSYDPDHDVRTMLWRGRPAGDPDHLIWL